MDNQQLVKFLAGVDLFSALDRPALEALTTKLERLELDEGSVLFEQGDPGDSLFAVVDGELRVEIDSEHGTNELGRLKTGQVLGEMAVIYGKARSARVSAVVDSSLVKLGRWPFEELLESQPQLRRISSQLIDRRLPGLRAATFSILGELDDETLHELTDQLRWRHLPGGEYLFHAGDEADALYIVGTGRLEVQVAGEDGPRTVAEIGPGEPVGEMALCSQHPRSASVQAIRDTELVRLSRSSFQELIRRHPESLMRITSYVVDRLRSTTINAVQRSHVTTIAVLSLDETDDTTGFGRRLAETLSEFDSTLYISAEVLDDSCGSGASSLAYDDPRSARVTDWLSQQECKHGFLVYEASAQWGPWTERCARQADQVLLLADGTADPARRPVERMLDEHRPTGRAAPALLILLHKEHGASSQNTAAWLAERQVHDHYHIRTYLPTDFARLARVLAGCAVGLVLGGGGARGLAHIGLLRAFEEHKVPIDFIGGTSIGAILAGLYATSQDIDYIKEMAHAEFVRAKPAKVFTVPLTSLIAGARIDRGLQRCFGEQQIEDLWLKFFCVSCNISKSGVEIHRRGLLWRAVRASLALPGIFPPVFKRGHVLVDGGVLNNIPVDLMKQHCGTVIASAVHGSYEKIVGEELKTCPSTTRILLRKVNPFKRSFELPSLGSIILGALACGSSRHAKQALELADYVVQPPVSDFGLLEFKRLDEIIEIGYQAACDQMDGLKTLLASHQAVRESR